MQMVGSNVRIVAKNEQHWDDGGVTLRVQMANGEGGLITCECTREIYEAVIPFEKVYDVLVNVDTNGYKHYTSLVSVHES